MMVTMLKAKLHQARVTHADLEYEGSCAVDAALLEAAGIHEYEMLHIYNLANGERFSTYAISAAAGSGVISVNGAAAHKASLGDRLIICAYGQLSQQEARNHKPRLLYIDEHNGISRHSNAIPVQVA